MRSIDPKGFTLIEVVAALAIVSIALLALLKLHLVSINTSDQAQTLTQAVLLAQGKMGETLCAGYPPVGVKSGVQQTEGLPLTWRTEVAEVRGSQAGIKGFNPGGLRRLSVEVAWPRGRGEKSIRLTTYVAESQIHGR